MSKKMIITIYSTIPPNLSTLLGSYATLSIPSPCILWVRSKFQLLQRLFLLFFMALTADHLESSAPSCESYTQLPHYFCSTANNGCKAQQKLFGVSKRNILAPYSFS